MLVEYFGGKGLSKLENPFWLHQKILGIDNASRFHAIDSKLILYVASMFGGGDFIIPQFYCCHWSSDIIVNRAIFTVSQSFFFRVWSFHKNNFLSTIFSCNRNVLLTFSRKRQQRWWSVDIRLYTFITPEEINCLALRPTYLLHLVVIPIIFIKCTIHFQLKEPQQYYDEFNITTAGNCKK